MKFVDRVATEKEYKNAVGFMTAKGTGGTVEDWDELVLDSLAEHGEENHMMIRARPFEHGNNKYAVLLIPPV